MSIFGSRGTGRAVRESLVIVIVALLKRLSCPAACFPPHPGGVEKGIGFYRRVIDKAVILQETEERFFILCRDVVTAQFALIERSPQSVKDCCCTAARREI